MIRVNNLCAKIFFIFLNFFYCAYAQSGGIKLEQTRIIFSASSKHQSITVSNTSKQNYLIQAKITDESHNDVDVPFLITPPLFLIRGTGNQILRIFTKDTSLPTNRESLFFLKVSAIPSQSTDVNRKDRISIGLRFVIKLLYRPISMPTPNKEAFCNIHFSREMKKLKIYNPTPYFQTIGFLSIDSVIKDGAKENLMIPPQGSIYTPFNTDPTVIKWRMINDFGALSELCTYVLTKKSKGNSD